MGDEPRDGWTDDLGLRAALQLSQSSEGSIAELRPGFSNAPMSLSAERGGPLGGLLAGLVVEAARQQLSLAAPLQSLSMQFMAPARFAPIAFKAQRVRGGRSIAYVAIEGVQGRRQVIAAQALFSTDAAGPAMAPLRRAPPAPVEALSSDDRQDSARPYFSRHFEYRFEHASRLGCGELPAFEQVWMRARDPAWLDEARLCVLLDAIYPTFLTSLTGPVPVAVTTGLHYEILAPLTPATSPDGWTFATFATQHLGAGWAVEDAVAYDRGGTPIALARQRRKLISEPPDSD